MCCPIIIFCGFKVPGIGGPWLPRGPAFLCVIYGRPGGGIRTRSNMYGPSRYSYANFSGTHLAHRNRFNVSFACLMRWSQSCVEKLASVVHSTEMKCALNFKMARSAEFAQ